MSRKPYLYLSKKRTQLSVVFTSNGLFCVLVSTRVRNKFLRDKNIFIGKVNVAYGDYDDSYKMELIREWWEGVDDEAIITRLKNVPSGQSLPVLNFDNKIFISFKIVEKNELVSWLFTKDDEILPDNYD